MPPEYLAFLTVMTDLGDSSVIGAIVVLAALYLLCSRCVKASFALVLVFVGASGAIALAKLVLLGCRTHHDDFGIHSPSGHTALSMAVYGMLAILLSSQLKGAWRAIPAIMAALLIGMIAASRVLLGFHTSGEVAAGLTIGLMAILPGYFLLFNKHSVKPRFRILPLVILIMIAAALIHGNKIPAEGYIRLIAARLKHYLPLCAEMD